MSTAGKTFHCSSCGARGDAIAFLMKQNGWRFEEAVASLSARFLGSLSDVPDLDPALLAIDRATAWYERVLWQDARAELAREHLRQRGIRPETARAWRLGYAPAEWTNLTGALQREGFSTSVLELAGLVARRPSGKGHYDRFRGRLMVPIRRDYRVIAFGGRLIEGESDAKYINSPETPLYKKGETFFGLDESRSSLVRGEPAIVVEGYFDAIALHQAGFATAVAACGTSVQVAQVVALGAAGAARVVFAFDGDAAGRAAAGRAAEASVGGSLQSAILVCPHGQDPDELLESDGPEGMRRRLANAKPAADFLIEDAFAHLRVDAAVELRAAAIERLAALSGEAHIDFTAEQIACVARLAGCSVGAVAQALQERAR